jgi:RNA polymerase sigma factor (sigma-70 family)
MNPADTASHLSQIQTKWTVVFQAHQEGDHASRAQNELAQRYLGAIYRYILGAVRDPHKADDLAQEFAIRLVRGAFKRATPDRGRFRDFVKAAVRNLITDDKRRVKPQQMHGNLPEPIAVEESPDSDDAFLDRWREELINRAWEGLATAEKQSGQPYHTVLRRKADNPALRSAQIAEELTRTLGKPMNEVAVRKLVQRSRERFAELLLEEVGRSIQSSNRSEIIEELVALGLHEYCKPALERSERK